MVGKLHGIPKTIVSDRDPVFLSAFWQNLFKLQGTTFKMSSAYHPQTDGQSEIVNKCVEQYLRCFISEDPQLWHKFLGLAEWNYNTSYHFSIHTTLFEVVYGRTPPTLANYIPGSTLIEAVEISLKSRDEKLRLLKAALESAQFKMKSNADKHRTDYSFNVGDLVLVKLQPYRQQSVATRVSHKFSKKYFGPFPILQKVGSVAYKLQLPATSKIHPVFHISLLKKFVGTNDTPHSSLPMDAINNQPVIQPVAVLDHRKKKVHHHWVDQYLVQWENLPLEESTWLDSHILKQLYPTLHLEGKVALKGVGIVTDVHNEHTFQTVAEEGIGRSPSPVWNSGNIHTKQGDEVYIINERQHNQGMTVEVEDEVHSNNDGPTDMDIEVTPAELEEITKLDELRRSRRMTREPTWMDNYIKGSKGKSRNRK